MDPGHHMLGDDEPGAKRGLYAFSVRHKRESVTDEDVDCFGTSIVGHATEGWVGESQCFTVLYKEGGVNFRVAVEGPSVTNVQMEDRDNGRYVIWWSGNQPGQYTVEVQTPSGEVCSGTPMTVNLRNGNCFHVESAGAEDGDAVCFLVNNQAVSGNFEPGLNIVTVDDHKFQSDQIAAHGFVSLIHATIATHSFPTHQSEVASADLLKLLLSISPTTVVLGAVQHDAWSCLTPDAVSALQNLFPVEELSFGSSGSFCFVGSPKASMHNYVTSCQKKRGEGVARCTATLPGLSRLVCGGDKQHALQALQNAMLMYNMALKDMFKAIDVNRDCLLDLDELINGLQRCGVNFDRSTVVDLFEMIDTDKDGKIDFKEMQAAMKVVDKCASCRFGACKSSGGFYDQESEDVHTVMLKIFQSKEQLRARFIELDLDGDGRLSSHEIHKVLDDMVDILPFGASKPVVAQLMHVFSEVAVEAAMLVDPKNKASDTHRHHHRRKGGGINFEMFLARFEAEIHIPNNQRDKHELLLQEQELALTRRGTLSDKTADSVDLTRGKAATKTKVPVDAGHHENHPVLSMIECSAIDFDGLLPWSSRAALNQSVQLVDGRMTAGDMHKMCLLRDHNAIPLELSPPFDHVHQAYSVNVEAYVTKLRLKIKTGDNKQVWLKVLDPAESNAHTVDPKVSKGDVFLERRIQDPVADNGCISIVDDALLFPLDQAEGTTIIKLQAFTRLASLSAEEPGESFECTDWVKSSTFKRNAKYRSMIFTIFVQQPATILVPSICKTIRQAVLRLAGCTHGRVVVAPGNYFEDQTINLTGQIAVIGTPPESVVEEKDLAGVVSYQVSGPSEVTITSHAAALFELNGGATLFGLNCVVSKRADAQSECILVSGGNPVIAMCDVTSQVGTGIALHKGSSSMLIATTVRNGGGHGVDMASGAKAAIFNCDISSNKGIGMFATDSLLQVQDSTFSNNGSAGLLIAQPKTDCTVSDSYFCGNSGLGVSLRNEAVGDFTHNFVFDNQGGGLDIESGAKGYFLKNHVFSNKAYGTRVEDAGEGIVYKGNITHHIEEENALKWLSSSRGSAKAPAAEDNAVIGSQVQTLSQSRMKVPLSDALYHAQESLRKLRENWQDRKFFVVQRSAISAKLEACGRCDHLFPPLIVKSRERRSSTFSGDISVHAGSGGITFVEASEVESDGVRSAQKVRQAFQYFLKKYDTDGSGRLELTEFARILQERGKCKLSDGAAATMMRTLDRDGNGYVDEEEFIAWSLGLNMAEGVAVKVVSSKS